MCCLIAGDGFLVDPSRQQPPRGGMAEDQMFDDLEQMLGNGGMGNGKVVGGAVKGASRAGVGGIGRRGSNTKIVPMGGGLDDLEDMNFDSK